MKAPRSRPGDPGAADERSVDMGESRDEPAPTASQPAPIASTTRLAPPQEAYGEYTRHALACDHCRDIDRERRCPEGERLWHEFHEISDQAFRRLAEETG